MTLALLGCLRCPPLHRILLHLQDRVQHLQYGARGDSLTCPGHLPCNVLYDTTRQHGSGCPIPSLTWRVPSWRPKYCTTTDCCGTAWAPIPKHSNTARAYTQLRHSNTACAYTQLRHSNNLLWHQTKHQTTSKRTATRKHGLWHVHLNLHQALSDKQT